MADLEAVPEGLPPSDEAPPVVLPPPPSGVGAGRAVLVILAFFFVQIAVALTVGIAAGLYLLIVKGDLTPAAVATIQHVVVLPAAVLGFVAGGLVALGLTFWGSWRSAARQATRHSIGWSGATHAHTLAATAVGLALAAAYILLSVTILPPDPHATWGPLATAASAGGWQRLLWALLAVLLAPPVEEFVFRGVLWAGLSRSLPAPVAAGLVTSIFVLSHVTEALGYWPAWLAITALAVAALAARVRAGSLLPPMALHASYNLGLVAATYLGAG